MIGRVLNEHVESGCVGGRGTRREAPREVEPALRLRRPPRGSPMPCGGEGVDA